jgi:preprotein translocase subunit SecG
MELTGPFNFLFLANSFFLIIFILNQNDSGKDITTQNSSSSFNIFERLTWFCFIFQLVFLLVKTKLTDF